MRFVSSTVDMMRQNTLWEISKEHVNNGTRTYNDHAVLYRTNAQSRMFEEKFVTDQHSV